MKMKLTHIAVERKMDGSPRNFNAYHYDTYDVETEHGDRYGVLVDHERRTVKGEHFGTWKALAAHTIETIMEEVRKAGELERSWDGYKIV